MSEQTQLTAQEQAAQEAQLIKERMSFFLKEKGLDNVTKNFTRAVANFELAQERYNNSPNEQNAEALMRASEAAQRAEIIAVGISARLADEAIQKGELNKDLTFNENYEGSFQKERNERIKEEAINKEYEQAKEEYKQYPCPETEREMIKKAPAIAKTLGQEWGATNNTDNSMATLKEKIIRERAQNLAANEATYNQLEDGDKPKFSSLVEHKNKPDRLKSELEKEIEAKAEELQKNHAI